MTTNPIHPSRLFARHVYDRPSLAALVNDPDGWAALITAHQRAAELLEAPQPPIPDTEIAREVGQALRDGTPIPEDFAARQDTAQRLTDLRVAGRRIIERHRIDISTDLALIAEGSVSEMVAGLQTEMTEVISRAANALTELNGSIDPLAAIEAGRTDAFRSLSEAHRTYLRIREDADFLLRHEDARTFDRDKGHRLMAGLATVWPTWQAVDSEPVAPGWSGPAGAPWPSDLASLEFFAWLVTNREVTLPWVPTLEALRAVLTVDGEAAFAEFQARHNLSALSGAGTPGQPTTGGLVVWAPKVHAA